METVQNDPPERELTPASTEPTPGDLCGVHLKLLSACSPTQLVPVPCAPEFFNEAIGLRRGFVAGECGHAVALSEWLTGFRVCERCPARGEDTDNRRSCSKCGDRVEVGLSSRDWCDGCEEEAASEAADAALLDELRQAAAANDPLPAVDSWVPVDWCRDAWHRASGKPDRPCPTCGQTDYLDASTSGWLDKAPAQPEPAPERRTVGLEVLTDELRAAVDAQRTAEEPEYMERAGRQLLAEARVAVVLREGASVAVSVVDTDWSLRSGPLLLARMIHHAQGQADQGYAELLMPGPDVLAVLAGQPDLQPWTEPLLLRADQVKPGWLAVDYRAPGVDDLIEEVRGCQDLTCPWYGNCVVIVAELVEPVHFANWHDLHVRIPAVAR